MMNMKLKLKVQYAVAAILLSLFCTATAADIFVISNSGAKLSATEVRDVFLGEKQLVDAVKLSPVDNGALQADFCVRIGDRNLTKRLREHAGRAVFEPGNPAMGMILAANPHRVFISRLGRIEVYQPIPPASGKSPGGPHTHVLPRLLKAGRTHPATEPIPPGFIPCAHLYPPHPARDGLGLPHPFDASHFDAFQAIMATFGDPAGTAIKQRVREAVRGGNPPAEITGDRHGRTSVRIALRQMNAAGDASPALTAWLANLDQGNLDQQDDDAALHGGC